MASCVWIISAKNYLNLIIHLQVTIDTLWYVLCLTVYFTSYFVYFVLYFM